MPPKQKITKEMIIEASFRLTKEHGFDSVNARNLAKEIGCSTQPIFSSYSSMIELKQDVYKYIESYYDAYIASRVNGENFFRDLGRAYIGFARSESNLFKTLFMSEFMGLNGLADMFSEENLQVAKIVADNLSISLDAAKNLFMKIWVFTHGIASMIATGSVHLSEEESSNMLKEAFAAFVAQAKK